MKIVSSSQDDSAVPNSTVSTGTDCTSTGKETASTAVI